MKTYVINLAKNTERLRTMAAQLDALGIPFERFEAYDGLSMAPDEVAAAIKARPLQSGWKPGEIGCLFSHQEIWRKVADGPYPYACVMEDDLHISQAIKRLFDQEVLFPRTFDLIRLEFSPGRVLLGKKALLTDQTTGVGLYRLKSPSWGAAAYIISRDCARQMVRIPIAEQRVSDYLLFDFDESPIAGKLALYQFSPAVAIQDKNYDDPTSKFHFVSDLDNDQPMRPHLSMMEALWTGNFPYILRTMRGYKRLSYVK
jgi:glycosyl transferase family 25